MELLQAQAEVDTYRTRSLGWVKAIYIHHDAAAFSGVMRVG